MRNLSPTTVAIPILLLAALALALTAAPVHAADRGDFRTDQQHATVTAQANGVFDCLQSRTRLRQRLQAILTAQYQYRDGHTADFAALKADYVLANRYYFLELNTIFNWRDLSDSLMKTLATICDVQDPRPTAPAHLIEHTEHRRSISTPRRHT